MLSQCQMKKVGIYNLDPLQRRAQSDVDYLVDSGISRSLLEPKELGESRPVVIQLYLGKEVELTP